MKKSIRIFIIIMMLLNILIQPVSEIITVIAEEDLSSNIIEVIEEENIIQSLKNGMLSVLTLIQKILDLV